MGSALTDLPPSGDATWRVLLKAAIPTLILCHGNDEVHPLSSGQALKGILPHATLLEAASLPEAEAQFPSRVGDFLRQALRSE